MSARLAIYGNCNLATLYSLLLRHHPDAYMYDHISFELFDAKMPLPQTIWDADLLIYQKTSVKGYESAPIVRRFKEAGKPSFCMPVLAFEGYHPDYLQDQLNPSTKSPQRPWGLFPYGMQAIMNLRGAMPVEQLIAETKKEDFIPSDYTQRRTEMSLALLKQTESACDVRLADYIESNYRSHFLFHTIDHPTNLLLQQLFDPVLDFLKLNRIDLSVQPELLQSCSPPVYPCVLKELALPEAPAVVLDHEKVTYEQYIRRYAALSTNDPVCRASILSSTVENVLPLAMPLKVRLLVRNDSSTTWFAKAPGDPEVKLSYHWMQSWQFYSYDNVRTDLPHDIAPGETVEMEVDLHTPEEVGSYTLAWDFVIEHVAWFSYLGPKLPRQQVEVRRL